MFDWRMGAVLAAATASFACGSDAGLKPPGPGVVVTYPGDGQLDVPLGSRVIVSFSDRINAEAIGACSGSGDQVQGAFCIVGPGGPLGDEVQVLGERQNVIAVDATLEPGTEYQVYARPALLHDAANLPASEALFSFRTRAERPRAALPELVAVNGAAPDNVGEPRPGGVPRIMDFDTLRLLFSEPIDRRSLELGSTVELLDGAGAPVPATLIAQGIHLSIDPEEDLRAGETYSVRLNDGIVDLGGDPLAAVEVSFTPGDTKGESGLIPQTLRTRLEGDPGPRDTRAGVAPNLVRIDKPLVGLEELQMGAGSIAASLGDPKAYGGPIPFVIRRGQRLAMGGLDVKLGGEIPAGLDTGDVEVHFISDATGVLTRNPYRPADQIPDNDRAPVHVELNFDVAVTARDATGNAVLSQTVLGVRGTGTATPTDGVLAIETIASMQLDLLGVDKAPTNMVLQLITDSEESSLPDRSGPRLESSYPASEQIDFPVYDSPTVTFDEPIDMARARAGGVRLEDAFGTEIASVLEQRGGSVVIRPLAPLAANTELDVVLDDVVDAAGNTLDGGTQIIPFTTEATGDTDVPATLLALHPGAPCALTGASGDRPGRCSGGLDDDDLYAPFDLPADENVEAYFDQPIDQASLTLGADCGTGSVRVEEVDGGGGCVAAVPGTLIRRQRGFAFVADQPWVPGKRYRLTLHSGGNQGCDAGEICSVLSGDAVNLDPLGGAAGGEGGGPDAVIDFVGAEAKGDTFVVSRTVPFSDQNGSGFVDGDEQPADANRAALKITGVNGDVTEATITSPDCLPDTPEVEGCMYTEGAVLVEMGELSSDCPLPGGGSAPSCIPARVYPQVVLGTSVTMAAQILGIGVDITTDTGLMVMRVREPPGGPPMGYIIDDGGTPKLVMLLELYMDAPDMSVTLSDHDLHSKAVDVLLDGPVSFFPDGRIRIELSNVEPIDMNVAIDGPVGVAGSIDTQVPAREMKLQILSPPVRGGEL